MPGGDGWLNGADSRVSISNGSMTIEFGGDNAIWVRDVTALDAEDLMFA